METLQGFLHRHLLLEWEGKARLPPIILGMWGSPSHLSAKCGGNLYFDMHINFPNLLTKSGAF